MSKLERRKVVAELLQERGDLLVIAGLGSAAYDVASVDNEPTDFSPINFPLWGAMGGTIMIGMGVALAQPDRNVLVLTGDGDALMGMGSFATVALQDPQNLRIVVLDNEQFGETGHQSTHTATVANLGPLLAVIKISSDEVPRVLPPRDGPYLANRFRAALLGEEQAHLA